MNYDIIKDYCELKGITIPELADKIGMTKSGLYQAISKRTLTVEKLEQIAKILNAPMWKYFDLDPEGPLKARITELEETVEQWKNDFDKSMLLNQDTDRNYNEAMELLSFTKILLKQWIKAYSILKTSRQLSEQLFNVISKYSNKLLQDEPPDEYWHDRLYEELIELASKTFVNTDLDEGKTMSQDEPFQSK